MNTYISYFKIRLKTGFQYRIAAFSGVVTQFFWGFMYLLLYKAFYETDPSSIPMEFDKLSSYIWLMQGLMVLLFIWFWDEEIFSSIENGNIAYELTRPIDLYKMWFAKILSSRLSKTFMRIVPIFLIATFLPKPYNLSLPENFQSFVLFLLSLTLGAGVLICFSIIIYTSALHTISAYGMRIFVAVTVDFLSGGILPLTFWPNKIRFFAELLPFSAIMNVPFRIYISDLSGSELLYHMALQLFWLLFLFFAGKWMLKRTIKKIVVQGG